MTEKRKSAVPSETITTSKRRKLSNEPLPGTVSKDVITNCNDTNKKTIAVLPFKIGEVVWCKIRGSSHWPAKILSYDNRKFDVFWFNDYRRSKVFTSQLFKFGKYFNEFAKKFNSSIRLETAAKEALLYLGQKTRN